MTGFSPKKLPAPENWGEKLRQARRLKNLKVADIAPKINIRASYLLALEEERWDDLPAGLYGKNFLKEYASFLGFNPKEIVMANQEMIGLSPRNPFSQKIDKKNKFIVFPKIIRNILISLAILICFLYLIFYFKKIILPPELKIISPVDNLLLNNQTILVSGQTEKEAAVKINGELVLNNHAGYFSQTVNLKKGLNNIIISAQKKYSRERSITKQVLAE